MLSAVAICMTKSVCLRKGSLKDGRSGINTYREFLIQLVGEKWVGKLSKVKLAQGAHTVYVLNVNIFCQIWDLFRVKFMPKKKRTHFYKTIKHFVLMRAN